MTKIVRARLVTVGEFKPGERVPESGVYRVTHDSRHRQPHEVTAVKGEGFPTCNGCGQHPRFRLVRSARHIGELVKIASGLWVKKPEF
jgi:hypothetical protein